MANRALYFVTTLRDRPDVYCDHLALFANDQDKITAQGALEVFQRASGIASKDGESALSMAHAKAFQNSNINAAGVIGERLYARWLPAPDALRETSEAGFAPPAAPSASSSAERDDVDGDDDDDDLKAGASVVATQLTSRVWTGTEARRPRHGTRPRRAPSMTCLRPSLSPASHLRYSGSSPPPTASSHG